MVISRDRKKGDFLVDKAPFRWFILQLKKGDYVFKKVKKGEKGELS